MAKGNNYLIQAGMARERFLTYDAEVLIRKLKLQTDGEYLYTRLLAQPYRIRRSTGDVERMENGAWVDANTFGEVMTLLDLVCDSREDRFLRGRWKNMASFGLLFHQNLLEGQRDIWADRFEDDPEGFRRACLALNGREVAMGDICYAIELFDGLEIAVQLWFGDEEFPASLRLLWDENALMYLKYETMYYVKGMLLERLWNEMSRGT